MTIEAAIKIERRDQALNGESPRWSAAEQALYWVDTRMAMLHRFDPSTGGDRTWEMPGWIGCAVLAPQSLLVAIRTGLFEFKWKDESLRQVAVAPYDSRRFLFNDGGCDPAGRFLVGHMYLPLEPGDAQKGDAPEEKRLYRLNGDGGWMKMAALAKTSNGLAWSPDGRTMYQSDTAKQTIFAFDYDVTEGVASNGRVFAEIETSDPQHGPDGAAVDTDGFYLTAVFGEGCLMRFDPSGRLERRIDLPVQYPTMVAYGGADLAAVYVTSANWMVAEVERDARPLEGGLFSFEAPVSGLPTNIYDTAR